MIICEKTEIWKILEIEKNNYNKHKGFVYVIDFGNCVKIGCTKKPYERLKHLCKMIEDYGSKKTIRFFVSDEHTNYRENESILHKLFGEERIIGTELFSVTFQEAVSMAENNIILKDETVILEEKSDIASENLKNMVIEVMKAVNENEVNDTTKKIVSKMDDDDLEEAIRLLEIYLNARKELKKLLEEFV